jgi:membrane protein
MMRVLRFGRVWGRLVFRSFGAFIEDDALSRAAAIAFYAATALAPMLFFVVTIAGIVFGEEAANGAVAEQLKGLIGPEASQLVQRAMAAASSNGMVANAAGVVVLLIIASGVFAEIREALNGIWKTESPRRWYLSLLIARLEALGLIGALGFLLVTSMVVTAAISGAGRYLDEHFLLAPALLYLLNLGASIVLTTIVFAGIYKVLPNKAISWRESLAGGLVTSLLFQVGQFVIGLYLGSSMVASLYGAAGGFVILMLWLYYSSAIFLLGAEFTVLYAAQQGRK